MTLFKYWIFIFGFYLLCFNHLSASEEKKLQFNEYKKQHIYAGPYFGTFNPSSKKYGTALNFGINAEKTVGESYLLKSKFGFLRANDNESKIQTLKGGFYIDSSIDIPVKKLDQHIFYGSAGLHFQSLESSFGFDLGAGYLYPINTDSFVRAELTLFQNMVLNASYTHEIPYLTSLYHNHFLKEKIKPISEDTISVPPIKEAIVLQNQSYSVFSKQLQNRLLAISKKSNRLSKLVWLETSILADRKTLDVPIEKANYSIINFNIKKGYKKSNNVSKLEILELLTLAHSQISPIPISQKKEKELKENTISIGNKTFEKEPMLTHVIEKENDTLVATQLTSLPLYGLFHTTDKVGTKITISDIDTSLVIFNSLLNQLENGLFSIKNIDGKIVIEANNTVKKRDTLLLISRIMSQHKAHTVINILSSISKLNLSTKDKEHLTYIYKELGLSPTIINDFNEKTNRQWLLSLTNRFITWKRQSKLNFDPEHKYRVIASSFTNFDNALKFQKDLYVKFIESEIIFVKKKKNFLYRVQTNAYAKKERAEKRLNELKKRGVEGYLYTIK